MSLHRIEILEGRIAPAIVVGLTDTNQLVSFDSAAPGTILATVAITGMGADAIVGIDFRPVDGELYALGFNFASVGTEGRLYTIDPESGVASAVGNRFGMPRSIGSTLNAATAFGFDFDPTADAIRVVSSGRDNFRLNPTTGAVAGSDTLLSPGGSQVVGAAYTSNFVGAGTATLLGIDFNANTLVRVGNVDDATSVNAGAVTTIGPLNFDVTNNLGFDILWQPGGPQIGLAALTVAGDGTDLYAINLGTGAATKVGDIGAAQLTLRGMAIAAAPPALAIAANGKSATFTDAEGDLVTVKVSRGVLTNGNFRFVTLAAGSQLATLDLDGDQAFASTTITITAKPQAGKGDGFAHVRFIDGREIDLGKVSVNGDLGRIDAGDGTTTTPGLAGLTVQSMGVVGGNQVSTINGKLGSLTVKTDFSRTQVNAVGNADGNIGNVVIGGDFIGTGAGVVSGIRADSAIGNLTIKGSLYGGQAVNVGSVFAGTSMRNVMVGGSIFGGSASFAGNIESDIMGNVTVKGSVFGGTDDHTGNVHAQTTMGNVLIGGSIVGGEVPAANELDSGLVYVNGGANPSMGAVKILGSLIGGPGLFSGSLFSAGTIKSVTVNGYLQGSTGGQSGNISSSGNIGAVKIAGDVLGGSGDYSGSIYTFDSGNVASITVGGSLTGTTALNGIIVRGQLGAVKIVGSVRGETPGDVRITALGVADSKVAAIKSLSIGGSVENANILAGYNAAALGPVNADASIGAVMVGGNWLASNLIAGTAQGGDMRFGTDDDVKIAEGVTDAIFAKIASLTIKGYAVGSLGGGSDRYGVVAEQIGKIKVGGATYALATGTDTTGLLLGPTPDFRVREV